MSRILEKIDKYLSEAEIDWKAVKEAARKTAKEIHGEADEKVIDDMIAKIKKQGKAEDTGDAIGIIQGMLKS